jgi:hypothetical protein
MLAPGLLAAKFFCGHIALQVLKHPPPHLLRELLYRFLHSPPLSHGAARSSVFNETLWCANLCLSYSLEFSGSGNASDVIAATSLDKILAPVIVGQQTKALV